jgi:23S rRNA pseudouridine2605 synthase
MLIRGGSIRVNGKIILAPYFNVSEEDVVECGGKRLELLAKAYVVMNKPVGVVCAVTDKYDPVVVDLLPAKLRTAHVFPVGRLDRESEGLLVLTNDGAFAQRVQHPSNGVTKEYEVLLNVAVNDKQLKRWRAGFEVEGRQVRPLSIAIMSKEPQARWVRVVVGEGLKREIRIMAQMTGLGVMTLIRRRIGFLTLEKLREGRFMELSFSDLYSKIFQGGSV